MFSNYTLILFPSQVYQRLQTKPSLAEKLDKYLANFNKSGQIYLGNLKLSLEVLGKSKSLLRQFLLQNPHLSESQYQMTLKLCASKVGEWPDCSTSKDLHKDASHLSQTRAAVQLLSKMRDRLTEDVTSTQDRIVKETSSTSPLSKVEEFPSAVTSEDIAVDVAAQCLFKHVEHQLQYGGKFGNCLSHPIASSLQILVRPSKTRVSLWTFY